MYTFRNPFDDFNKRLPNIFRFQLYCICHCFVFEILCLYIFVCTCLSLCQNILVFFSFFHAAYDTALRRYHSESPNSLQTNPSLIQTRHTNMSYRFPSLLMSRYLRNIRPLTPSIPLPQQTPLYSSPQISLNKLYPQAISCLLPSSLCAPSGIRTLFFGNSVTPIL